MATERSAEDIRSLANRFRGMLNERETQALSNVRAAEGKDIGAPNPTPRPTQPTPADVAERYRHLGEKSQEGREANGPLRPAPTPEVQKPSRGGPER